MSFKGLLRPVLLSLSLFVVSCSIKENRAECPCALTLELTGLPVRPVVLGVAGEGYSFTQVVHADTVIVLPVPKGELAVSAVGPTNFLLLLTMGKDHCEMNCLW